jgi:hypothetical protein
LKDYPEGTCLQQSPLDLEDAVLAATTSSMAIRGLVKEEMIFYTMPHPGNEMLAWLPNVRVMLNTAPDREAQFVLAVRSLMDGLHARDPQSKHFGPSSINQTGRQCSA